MEACSFCLDNALHYGQNRAAAIEFFRKAEELPGMQQSYVRHFLPAKPIAQAKLPAEAGIEMKMPAEASN